VVGVRESTTLAITPQMWWVLEKHRSNTLLHFHDNLNHIVFFTEDQYPYMVFYLFYFFYKTRTSHNGNRIPLKKAAGLNKDFLTA
jgi:hypothetical protein